MLSKNALNNMKNRYTAVLKKCTLLNTFGSLALATVMATGATMATLATPADAMAADEALINVDSSASKWTSSGNITKTDFTPKADGDYFSGVYAETGADAITMTLANGDTITVKGSADGMDYAIEGISSFRDNTTIINDGTINVTAYGEDTCTTGIYVDAIGDTSITNSGTMNVSAFAESTADDASAGAYGMLTWWGGGDMTLTNSGTINSTAYAYSEADDTDADAYASAMYAYRYGDITFTNSGTITIKVYAEKAGTVSDSNSYANADATGMEAWGSEGDITFINTGTINATAYAYSTVDSTEAKAYGMYGYAEYSGDITFTNSGTINATAYAYSTVDSTEAKAYGMNAMGAGDLTLTNSGTVNVSSYAYSGSDTAYAYAHGMMAYTSNAGDITLTNSGTITAEAYVYSTVDSTDATASGMNAMGLGDLTLTNSGTINVSSYAYSESDDDDEKYASASAIAMSAMGFGDVTLTNSGTINVTANAYSDYADTEAYGMIAGGLGDVTLTNNGIITMSTTVDGDDANAMAIGMGLLDSTGTIINNGVINVSADATGENSSAIAVGIFVGSESDDLSIIHNNGIINVTADATGTDATAYAYQAYVSSCATANVGTWNMVLGETYGTDSTGGTGYYVFGVEDGGTLTFDNNTEFVVIGLGSDFKEGTKYAIGDMINLEEDDSTVTGSVGSVSSAYDMLKVTLINPDSDYDKQYITAKVNITAKNSPAHGAAMSAMSGTTGYMNKLGNILGGLMTGGKGGPKGGQPNQSSGAFNIYDTSTMSADSGSTFTDAGGSYVSQDSPLWDAFILPFYGYTSENGGDYSTDMYGLAMGATRAVCDNLSLGFHFSVAKADSDADYTDSDAVSYALGLHGMYNVDDAWYVRGQVSGFYSESDLDMVGSTSNNMTTATADMDTYGVYVELATGYDIELAPAHTITPEVALSYMYAHMEGFDSEYYMNGSATGTTFGMDSEDYDALYADASVRWTGEYDFESGVLKPTAKVGIRQALTDPEVSSTLEIFGTKSTTYSDLNETAFTCEAGLAWEIGDVTTSLTYVGEFGDVEYSHMGMFKVAWEF